MQLNEYDFFAFLRGLSKSQRAAQTSSGPADSSPSMGPETRWACHVSMRTGEWYPERSEIKLAYEDPAADYVQEVLS